MRKLYLIFLPFVIFLVSILGCALLNKSSGQFSHKAHTAEGLNCKACHISALKDDKAGMPKESKCVYCHETVYDGKPVAEIYTLNEWQSARGADLDIFVDVKFSHKEHMNYGKECSDCHKDVGNSEMVISDHIPNANTCVKCHNQWLNQELCSKCHITTRLNTPPEDHKRSDFMLVHGQRLKGKPFDNWIEGTGRHSHLCFECHNQDHCIKCHNEIEPRNHTNEWRLIGHGVSAGIDRNNCKTCHKVDFCFRCHDETRPRSHVANWGATRSRHCAYCHEPLSSNNCIVCHKSTPSHDEAPNAPLFVRKDWPCRLCHFTIVPLDHFDNGDDCENCHKTTRPSRRQARRRGRFRQ